VDAAALDFSLHPSDSKHTKDGGSSVLLLLLLRQTEWPATTDQMPSLPQLQAIPNFHCRAHFLYLGNWVTAMAGQVVDELCVQHDAARKAQQLPLELSLPRLAHQPHQHLGNDLDY